MEFKEMLLKLSEKIAKQREVILTEEGTKNAFIMPMITALGYDIFDPYEVVPEMDCDLTNRGDKVDYAINIDGKISILIECKNWKQNLNINETQLKKYFAASNARFAILTNGVYYNFYTDTDKANIMDNKPFFIIDMLNLNDNDIDHLQKFRKSNYDGGKIIQTASILKTKSLIKDIVYRELDNPSSEFIRYFVREINGMSNQKLIDKYQPLVKDSIKSYIDNNTNKKISHKTSNESIVAIPDDKLESFYIIRNVLNKNLGDVVLGYKDYKSYFVINFSDSVWDWVCRVSIRPNSKRICIPYNNYKENKWYEINSLEEISNFHKELIEAYKLASKTN